MKTPRFCIDCQHQQRKRELFVIPVDMCGHPTLCDPVTRKALHRCHEVRAEGRPCGLRARLYEPVRVVETPDMHEWRQEQQRRLQNNVDPLKPTQRKMLWEDIGYPIERVVRPLAKRIREA